MKVLKSPVTDFFAVMLGDAKLASEFADEMLGKKILMT